jgi:hypothetical protein
MPICYKESCKGGCGFTHVDSLRKSSKLCKYHGNCKFKKMCPYLHPGEDALIGKIFWDRYPPELPPCSAQPNDRSNFATPAHGASAVASDSLPVLANPPLLLPILDFLNQYDRVSLKLTHSHLNEIIKAEHPSHSIMITYLGSLPSVSSVRYVRHLAFQEFKIYAGYSHSHHDKWIKSFESVLEGMIDLQTIKILNEHFSVRGVDILASFKKLQSITFGSGVRINTIDRFIELLPQMTNLRVLNLDKTILDTDVWASLLRILPETKIESLTHRCSLDGWTIPEKPIEKLKHLELYIQGGTSNPLRLFEKLPNLNSLTLKWMYTTPFREIPSIKFPSVEKLYLSGPSMCVKHTLEDFFRCFPNLKELTLNTFDVSAFETLNINHFFPMLKRLEIGSPVGLDFEQFPPQFFKTIPNSLEQLHLHGTHIKTATGLIPELPRLKHLWSFGINGNPLKEVLLLAEALATSNSGLEELGFTIPTLTDKTALECVQFFKRLPHLMSLFLYSSGFKSPTLSRSTMKKIRETLPTTTVIEHGRQSYEKKVRSYPFVEIV